MREKSYKARQKVLETASTLFHRQGYQSTGINQISAESGVVKSSIYQHFRSKEELGAEYLKSRHVYWFDRLKDFIGSAKTLSEKLNAAFDFISYINAEENYRGCAFLKMLAEIPADNEVIMKIIKEHKEVLRTFFGEMLTGKPIDPDVVYQLFESAILESQLFRTDWPIDTAKRFIHSILIKN
ncbi:TetR family transcriptional regulator [Chitinophaga polysaccharea]|uniref:TetR family transcriptional regulator n=1 Tax=Chitinophaga polysaccharea TaxID=1293035 RepID=A0A561PC81_9BACT|nr:TetR/AcrR family transcriptional regulator [Chitinophaga polysaccharea]TWF35708.1 TetR family transcriptional regulator [Chitinophaga polysaccharea]